MKIIQECYKNNVIVSLVWFSRHNGIQGNEKVDQSIPENPLC